MPIHNYIFDSYREELKKIKEAIELLEKMVIWFTTKTKNMTPIGKYIIINKIKEEKKTKSGLLLSADDVDSFRYQKGKVVKAGTLVNEIRR